MNVVTLVRKLPKLSFQNSFVTLRDFRCDHRYGKHTQPVVSGVLLRRHLSTSTPREQNNSEKNKTLVYLGSIRSTVKMVKGLSLTTSFLGILAQPILLQKLSGASLGATVIVVSCASFFIFVTPLMLHYITRRYVTELTYDPDTKEFNATTLSLLNRKKHISFIADDIKVPAIPGPFTTLLAKGRPLFVEVQNIQDADALELLMGYDKPVDLQMKLPNAQEEQTEMKRKQPAQCSDKES
uniref:Transmembrane protein 70 mitochondrial n=1 Tax=Rhipicephalus zambeziensis TaxID=60191 RepID=A0A224ZA53_9ACAR